MDRYSISIASSGIGELSFAKAETYEGITLELTSVTVDKEMYKPGCIKAEIKLTKTGEVTEAECSKIVEQLLGKSVSISGTFDYDKDKVYQIGRGYTVYNVEPHRTYYGGGLQTVLLLSMYSPDKFMDIRKYSKCYTAKCLGSDVLEDAIKAVKETDKLQILCDYTHQQRMQVECTNPEMKTYTSEQNGKSVSCIEGVQPYMVQYNETAHNFISRIANRCGEFFYYNDEKLVLGLDTTGSQAIKVTPKTADCPNKINVLKSVVTGGTVFNIDNGDIADVSYSKFVATDEYDAQCPNYTTEYEKEDLPKRHVQKDDKDKYPCVQTYEGPSIEDFVGYSKEPKLDHPCKSYEKPKTWLQMIFFMLQKDTVLDMGLYVAANVTITALQDVFKNITSARDYKTGFVEKYEKQGNVHNGKSKVYQFCLAEEYNLVLSNAFYQMNKDCSEVARKGIITVKLRETSNKALKLGDFVNVFGCEYVVTKVHYEAQKNVKTRDKDNWFEAVPALAVKEKDSYKVRYVPATLPGGTKRTAAPQRAIVKNTKDPLSLGRVRILYPWQPDEESQASPFIRVTQPYASSKSGIRFTPQVGDEIMVGYEFDDIERPFMMGAIASMNTNGSKVNGNDNIICSPNGHQIKFTNPGNAKGFIEGFVPVIKSLDNMGLSSEWKSLKFSPEIGGSMQFTDSYGVYNVELSTDYRRIRVQSHLGCIEMSAMTGITINCPTGDVSIKGKNVSIEAGDKVTITSGKNIGTQRLYAGSKKKSDGWKSFGQSLLSSFTSNFINDIRIKDFAHGNVVDLTAMRAVIDAFVKPINGTLLIKSNRFMMLEAGKGKTYLKETMYRKGNAAKNTKASHLYTKEEKKKKKKQLRAENIYTYLAGASNWYWAYDRIRDTALDAAMQLPEQLSNGQTIIAMDGGNFNSVNRKEIQKKLVGFYNSGKQKDGVISDWQKYVNDLREKIRDNTYLELDDKIKEDIFTPGRDYIEQRFKVKDHNDDTANNLIPAEHKYIDKLKTIHTELLDRYNAIQQDANEDRVRMWREFMYDVIKLLRDKKMLVIGNKPKDRSDWLLKDKEIDWKDKGRNATCETQASFNKFVETLDVREENQTWAAVKEYFGIKKLKDTITLDTAFETNALWESETEGSILISDGNTNGGTVRIKKEELVEQDGTPRFVYDIGSKSLQEIISSLKGVNGVDELLAVDKYAWHDDAEIQQVEPEEEQPQGQQGQQPQGQQGQQPQGQQGPQEPNNENNNGAGGN